MGNDIFTEGIFDKMKVASTVVGGANDAMSKRKIDNRSIVKRAKNSIAQFPIYMTSIGITANSAHVISKAIERVYVSLFQAVVSQHPIIEDINDVNNLKFFKQFHTNIEPETPTVKKMINDTLNEYYQPIDDFDAMLYESLYNEISVEGGQIIFEYSPISNLRLAQESARLCTDPLQGFSYLTEYTAKYSKEEIDDSKEDRERAKEKKEEAKDRSKEEREKAKEEREETSNKISQANLRLAQNKNKREEAKSERDAKEHAEKMRETRSSTAEVLKDTDVKKLNGMQPYNLNVKFRVQPRGKDGQPTGEGFDQVFTIGVKTVLHLFDPEDLADDVREIISGNLKGLQKVRYKTGEITWLKDYILNLKNIKKDAAKNLGHKRWLGTLKRLGEYEKTHGAALKNPAKILAGGHVPIPNGTLVLSESDITTIKEKSGIDLRDLRHAKSLSKSLFLICVAIVDSSRGTMRIYFPDTDSEWDVQSLASLDAEASKMDNSKLVADLRNTIRK